MLNGVMFLFNCPNIYIFSIEYLTLSFSVFGLILDADNYEF